MRKPFLLPVFSLILFSFFVSVAPSADAQPACVSNGGSAGTCSSSGCAAGSVADGQGNCAAGEECCIAGGGGGAVPIQFGNPLAVETVEDALTLFLDALQGVIVTLALVFLVIGAVLYIVSAGDEGRMKTAKGAIFAAMIGLAIGIAAPSFLNEIYKILGGAGGAKCDTDGDRVATEDECATIAGILSNVLDFLLAMIGILAIIMLVVGGATYLTSAGDETKAETGKKIVKWAMVGIAVALGSLVIVRQITAFFV